MFELVSNYKPSGDQPEAIKELVEGIKNNKKQQVLLGATGTGKTFTIANVIKEVNKPTLVLAHNKTLAGQLYAELKELFPNNRVEFFISYYDYYQPEAYVPQSDTYIDKTSSINDEIDELRHSATNALISRKDVIVVASVSCIYGIGEKEEYEKNMLTLNVGDGIDRNHVLKKLVDMLYERYCENNAGKEETLNVTREGLREWYDGYFTKNGERMYNPRSVVAALENNNLGSYWTSSGPYDEIFYYVENNIADVRKDIALMISGEGVKAKIQEYAATSMNLLTREEILSAMVVYGFLSYYNGKVYIPNKELMDKFDEMVQKEASLGYVYRLAKESERMLEATLHGDTETMENILAYVHNTETPILSYNNETELSAVVNLVYLAARDRYRVEREDKSGKGFVDFIFYPEDRSDTCIILELKVDHTPEEAIEQIRDKDYMLRFMGKLGELPKYTGEILGVGISYSKTDKIHRCKTEILRNRI